MPVRSKRSISSPAYFYGAKKAKSLKQLSDFFVKKTRQYAENELNLFQNPAHFHPIPGIDSQDIGTFCKGTCSNTDFFGL